MTKKMNTQCGLHAVLGSHIGILMRLLAADPRCTARPLFPSQCLCGMIMLTPYSMVWDWRVSRAGPMLFHWPKLIDPLWSSTVLHFLFFQSKGWYCGLGSLSPSLEQQTTFNNNDNNWSYIWIDEKYVRDKEAMFSAFSPTHDKLYIIIM